MNNILRKYKRPLSLSFIVGMIVFVAIFLFADIQSVKKVFSEFNLKLLPLIIALAPLNYLLRYIKWNYFLSIVGLRPELKMNRYIFMSGLSMTVTPGKVGELLKCFLLKEHMNASVSTTSSIVMAERLTDAMAMVLLASLGALAFDYGGYVLLITSIAMIIIVTIFHSDGLFKRIAFLLVKIPRLEKGTVFLRDFQQSSKAIFSLPSLLFAVGIGVVSWGFEGFVIYFAVQAFGGHISILNALFVVSFSAILGALSFIPGGLGVAEGSILGLLIMTGVGKEIAAASTIITRFSTLWLGVVIGIVGLILVEKEFFKEQKP